MFKKEEMIKQNITNMKGYLNDINSKLNKKGMALSILAKIPDLRAEINVHLAENGEAQVTGDTIFISLTRSVFGDHGCSMLLNFDRANCQPYPHTFQLRKFPAMWFCCMATEEIKEGVMGLMENLAADDRLVVNFTMA